MDDVRNSIFFNTKSITITITWPLAKQIKNIYIGTHEPGVNFIVSYNTFCIQLFRERLSNKIIKAKATIPKSIMGCGSSLFRRQVHDASWILTFY